MTRLAIAWLIFRLTGSALWLGAAAFAGQAPVLLCAPVCGPLLDRFGGRRLLLATQMAAFAQAAALVLLATHQRLDPGTILIMAAIRGCISAFEVPARQTLLMEFDGMESHPATAFAADSAQVNIARLAGPLAGAFVLSHWGETFCFLIDAITDLLPVALLITDRGLRPSHPPAPNSLPADGGWRSALSQKDVPELSCLLAITAALASAFTTLLPQYATTVLGGGPELLGSLIFFSSIGAIVSALLLTETVIKSLNVKASTLYPITGIVFVMLWANTIQYISCALSLIVSALIMMQLVTGRSLLQVAIPSRMKGRAVTFQSALFYGAMPVGSLLTGALAQIWGPANAYLAAGTCCAGAGLGVAIAARRRVHRSRT